MKNKLYRQEIKPIDAINVTAMLIMALIVVLVVWGVFWALCAGLDSGAIL